MLSQPNATAPLVSVLMPAYNAEFFINDSIASIVNQTFSSFELIIVDDCSRDKTHECANNWSIKDARISVYKNQFNLGIAGNRNKLLSLARAKYIAWQDADDISLPNRLAIQYEFLESNPRVGIVGCAIGEHQKINFRIASSALG